MSSENIQGLLLEEFLAEQLGEYGWHCCWGESVRHVDFCNVNGSLLQVKNRSNSENSSSSRVRINQLIEKWYRVDAGTGLYRWSYFNEKYDTDRFSEENFVMFVQQALIGNPGALAVEKIIFGSFCPNHQIKFNESCSSDGSSRQPKVSIAQLTSSVLW